MTDKPIKTFKEDLFTRFQKHGFVLFFIPTSFLSQYVMIILTINDIKEKNFGFEFIIGIFVFFGMFFVEYICFVYLKEIKNTANTIEIYPDKIIGHAQYKKNKWSINYIDIHKIYTTKVFQASFVIEDLQKHKYRISAMMNFLQEIIEYIKHKSTNLEVYDLGTVPKNKIEWKKSDDPII